MTALEKDQQLNIQEEADVLGGNEKDTQCDPAVADKGALYQEDSCWVHCSLIDGANVNS